MMSLGWFGMVVFILSNFYFGAISTLVVLLAFSLILFGLVIVPLKHYMLYTFLDGEEKEQIVRAKIQANEYEVQDPHLKYPLTKNMFKTIVPIALVMLLVYSLILGQVGNGLHALPEQEETSSTTWNGEYRNQLIEQIEAEDTLYFIASYGGGLKANIWNLLILDTLFNSNGAFQIMDKTLAMSGVSGGALGQAFYLSLLDRRDSRKIIRNVGASDFLSGDISFLLGFDLLRELVPFRADFQTRDRSGCSMERYASLFSDSTMTEVPFQAYWRNKYLACNRRLPVLIANTMGTNHKRGIACSIDFERVFPDVFPNSIDILDLPGAKTLSYTDAVSTSNRFPVISPAAKIISRGHFVDGGYFENSGLLSLVDYYDFLRRDRLIDSLLNNRTIIFIQINNGRRSWVKHDAQDLMNKALELEDQYSNVRESAELNSVIGTITSLDDLPEYVLARLEKHAKDLPQIKVVQILLPYRYDIDYVKSLLQKTPANILELGAKADKNNAELQEVLSQTNGYHHPSIVEPVTARVLTQAPVDYMEVIMQKGGVLDSLRSIMN
ncbi:MAG: patatin-like phospholipase family protein [Saprospiraceae bacterium]|nr:patatin-like phospholipase family protein [Saprospiraceae bacterium]